MLKPEYHIGEIDTTGSPDDPGPDGVLTVYEITTAENLVLSAKEIP